MNKQQFIKNLKKINYKELTFSNFMKTFIFYLTETEGNGDIVEIGLHSGAVTLNDGICYATQALSVTKDATQSINIEWNMEVAGE